MATISPPGEGEDEEVMVVGNTTAPLSNAFNNKTAWAFMMQPKPKQHSAVSSANKPPPAATNATVPAKKRGRPKESSKEVSLDGLGMIENQDGNVQDLTEEAPYTTKHRKNYHVGQDKVNMDNALQICVKMQGQARNSDVNFKRVSKDWDVDEKALRFRFASLNSTTTTNKRGRKVFLPSGAEGKIAIFGS